jgi:hypothetical protein
MGRAQGQPIPAHCIPAFLLFAIVWFAFCAYNMWVGVNSAGYAMTEELPFLAINFLVPVGVVFALRRRITGMT